MQATTAAHSSGDSVTVQGGFSTGVIPPAASPWNYVNGSTAAVLKLFGDINGDGNMVYIEYSVSPACICTATCNPSSTSGNLYRNSMAWNATPPKVSATASQILLGNVTANPNSTACFSYQPVLSIHGNTYVTDVAVTLTVQTQIIDPITRKVQTETKALLNVSPRNVYNTSVLDGFGYVERVQSIPAQITALLAGAS